MNRVLTYFRKWFQSPLGATTFFFYSSFLFLFFNWLPLNFPWGEKLEPMGFVGSFILTTLYVMGVGLIFKRKSVCFTNKFSLICLCALVFNDVLHPAFPFSRINSYFMTSPKAPYFGVVVSIVLAALISSWLFGRALSPIYKWEKSKVLYVSYSCIAASCATGLLSFILIGLDMIIYANQELLDWNHYPYVVMLWIGYSLFNSILIVPIGLALGFINSVLYKKLCEE